MEKINKAKNPGGDAWYIYKLKNNNLMIRSNYELKMTQK